jgi:hypothetical protein
MHVPNVRARGKDQNCVSKARRGYTEVMMKDTFHSKISSLIERNHVCHELKACSK